MDAKDLNSGLHICQQATLPIKPSSTPTIWMVLFGFGFLLLLLFGLGFFFFVSWFFFFLFCWCLMVSTMSYILHVVTKISKGGISYPVLLPSLIAPGFSVRRPTI